MRTMQWPVRYNLRSIADTGPACAAMRRIVYCNLPRHRYLLPRVAQRHINNVGGRGVGLNLVLLPLERVTRVERPVGRNAPAHARLDPEIRALVRGDCRTDVSGLIESHAERGGPGGRQILVHARAQHIGLNQRAHPAWIELAPQARGHATRFPTVAQSSRRRVAGGISLDI